MTDTEAEEDLLVRWERRIADIPLEAMSNTERLVHDLGAEVWRLRKEKTAHEEAGCYSW